MYILVSWRIADLSQNSPSTMLISDRDLHLFSGSGFVINPYAAGD